MCMTTVDKAFDAPLEKEMVGYKVFIRQEDGTLRFPCRPNGQEPKLGETLPSVGWFRLESEAEPWDDYAPGFHFFPTREAVRKYRRDMLTWPRYQPGATDDLTERRLVVVKCRFSALRAKGVSGLPAALPAAQRPVSLPTYVAGKMTLLSFVR